MAAYLSTLISAVRARVVTIWPDTPVNGIWEAEDLEMVSWDQMLPPYAAIVLGEVQDADDWGGQNACYEIDMDIYYVGNTGGDSSSIRTQLEALRDSLLTSDLTRGQVLDVSGISHDNSLAPNQILSAKNYTHRAGRIRVRLLDGETLGS